ncbi:MAG: arginine deiminase family protein, partial [Gammaproteobacteria bacterium]
SSYWYNGNIYTNEMTRGIEVLELHTLLSEILALPHARAWLLDRKITPAEVGLGLAADIRAYLDQMESLEL